MMTDVYTQEHATIYGHGIWHYLADTTVGQIHIIQYEDKGMALQTQLVYWDNDKAEKLFKKACKDMLAGKYL